MDYLNFILLAGFLGLYACGQQATQNANQAEEQPPNVVIIFADDLGYGDLACYGHPSINTPNLDRMAREGQQWTDFYVAASVCTPSRAGLLTGRYPVRSGMTSDRRRVLFPDSGSGIPAEERTIAELLKSQGYATAAVGKWHLGHLPQFLPTSNGFDTYFGIPYSNDMDPTRGSRDTLTRRERFWDPKAAYWNVPLMQDEEIIERPADQTTITKRYAEKAVDFIRTNKEQPFFLYLAHSMPHVPLFASEDFLGTSRRGLYGDVIEEVDWSVGQVLRAIEEEGLAENTLVVFTSDNGPWLAYDDHGGSAGLLFDGKGTTWEGGMRVPAIFWGPGRVQPGVVHDMGSTLDLLPTIAAQTGTPVPEDKVLDGFDLTPALTGEDVSPRDHMIFYRGTRIFAARKGAYKAHFVTQREYVRPKPVIEHDPPLLYHLGVDPGELYNIAEEHPEVIEEIIQLVEEHQATVEPAEDQLVIRLDQE